MAELARIPLPSNGDGSSFAALLQQPTAPHRVAALSQFPRCCPVSPPTAVPAPALLATGESVLGSSPLFSCAFSPTTPTCRTKAARSTSGAAVVGNSTSWGIACALIAGGLLCGQCGMGREAPHFGTRIATLWSCVSAGFPLLQRSTSSDGYALFMRCHPADLRSTAIR